MVYTLSKAVFGPMHLKAKILKFNDEGDTTVELQPSIRYHLVRDIALSVLSILTVQFKLWHN